MALAVGYAFLGSQAALDYVLRRAVEESLGHLTIEGAQGSLLSTIRVARIAWQGDQVDVEAREIALTWSPLDLVSPCPIVLVAIRPKQPFGRSRLNARRKK